jgi:peptidoglycan/xylan/chitin deacetylase (PgdA/CDA1 family)
VNHNELWRPGTDPNAETQRARPEGPVAPFLPQQAGEREEPAATRLAPGPAWNGAPFAGHSGRYDGRDEDGPEPGHGGRVRGRSVNRRRVLFAAGGVMLLAGGGVAAAMESGGKGSPQAGAAPAGTRSASAAPSSAVPTAPQSTLAASASPSGAPSPVPTSPQWYVDDDGPMAIALTMDDGPSPVYTPMVLEILREHGIKATFNMIGQQVGGNLSLVREVSAEGHTITNHTWDHADLSKLSVKQVLDEMDRCNEALANANQHPTIFRAPYGNWSPEVYEACAERNLKPVGWSVDPRDWDVEHVTVQMIVDNVMEHTHAHDIILEHDGPSQREHTVEALRIFIPRLLEKGFNFVAM